MKTDCQIRIEERRQAFRTAFNDAMELAEAGAGSTPVVTLATVMAGKAVGEVMRLFDAEYSEAAGDTIEEQEQYRRQQDGLSIACTVLRDTGMGDDAQGCRSAALAVVEQYLKPDKETT